MIDKGCLLPVLGSIAAVTTGYKYGPAFGYSPFFGSLLGLGIFIAALAITLIAVDVLWRIRRNRSKNQT
jgi:hypothetical protein